MRENAIRTIWSQGGCVLNGWLAIPDGFAAEVMAHQGWDSLTIDMQHGLADFGAAMRMLHAIGTTSVMPLARVPWNEPGIIMRMLDAGCFGIICPMINSRAECERFVGACRYPPAGFRSYGPTRVSLYAGEDYAANANNAVITMAMIETREAMENLDEILSTPGLDAVYIGPSDLAQSHGLPPRMDPTTPEVVAMLDRIVEIAKRHAVVVGMHTGSATYAQQMQAKGMQFVTVMSDSRLLASAAGAVVKAFHGDTRDQRTSAY